MKKILTFGLLIILTVTMANDINAGDLELWRLREMFKAKLGPDPTYFPDQTIDQINMKSAQIVSIHGFCCSQIDTIVLQSGQIDYSVSQHSLWNYAMKPLVSSSSDERAWQSINIQDVGKKWTSTVSIPNFFYNWTDQFVHVHSAPTATDSVLLYYFAYLPTVFPVEDTAITTLTNCSVVDIDVNDNIYAGTYNWVPGVCALLKSADSAVTWDTVWSSSFDEKPFHGLFVASNNYVYAGRFLDSVVIRSTDGGSTWDTCLTFAIDSSYFWQMAEDTLGNLFIGEYCYTDTHFRNNATIWKSTDDGASWDTSYYNSNCRHIHAIAVDPYTNYVYATMDYIYATPEDLAKVVFVRSTDVGVTWDTIAVGSKARYTGIEFSANYRILADDYTTVSASDIFITDDDDSANFTSTYSLPHGWFRDIERFGNNYYAAFVPSWGKPADPCLVVSYDEGQHWSIARSYPVGYNGMIENIASRSVDGWVFFTYKDSDYPDGQLRKFKETIRPADLDNKCRDAILTLSTMQYWIRNGRTDLAVNYWNLASLQMQALRQGFLQKAYDIIVTTKIREDK